MTTAEHNLKLSIVIVSYNAAAVIRTAIDSVVTQTDPNLELVIIDGGSTDGTVDIIREYGTKISWVSEKDHGIYDAMNKGIIRATGDYILFLGADDVLASPSVIEQASREIQSFGWPDMWCGRVKIGSSGSQLHKISGFTLTDQDVIAGHMPPHQGMIAKTALLREHFFDLSYRICADREFFVWAWSAGKRICFSDLCVANYASGGASGSSFLAAKEGAETVQKYYPKTVSRFIKVKSYSKIFILLLLERLRILTPIRRLMGRWQNKK